jgi:transposase-like protein
VADWLNANNVPVGPYCDLDRWDGAMVSRITHNPILKGVRVRNRMHCVKHNQTGRRRSVKCDQPRFRTCPHLAFIDPDRYDRVLRLLDQRNGRFRRKGIAAGQDPCRGRPKRRTTWPGGHCFCGICGRLFNYGAHGRKDHLICKEAKQHCCWNSVSLDGPDTARRIAAKVLAEIEALPDFDEEFLAMVRRQVEDVNGDRRRRMTEIDRRVATLERHGQNLLKSLRELGPSSMLKKDLDRIEQEREDLAIARKEAERAAGVPITVPPLEQIKATARAAFTDLATNDGEFVRRIKRLIPRLVLFPYRLCDQGSALVLRVRFTLNLAPLVIGGNAVPGLQQRLSRELEVDLFDPPQREAYRAEVVRRLAESEGITLKSIAAELGVTEPAVQRAVRLHRRMAELDLSEAYVQVAEPPSDSKRLRRHQHVRYRFEPLGRFEDEPQVDDGSEAAIDALEELDAESAIGIEPAAGSKPAPANEDDTGRGAAGYPASDAA